MSDPSVPPSLHLDWVGPPDGRRALIAHGILGMGRNWRSMARKLSERLEGWQFALVDLRNHGRSQGFAPPHTVASSAADLAVLERRHGPFEVAIGHSFGGKVVLQWAFSGAELGQVWVLDSPPGPRPADPETLDTLGVIESVRSVGVPAPDRDRVRDHLRSRGLPEPLVMWLLTSLRRDADGWRWVWDLDAIDAMIHDYLALDLMGPLTRWTGAPIELVRAGRSDRWLPSEIEALEALPSESPVHLHLLSNAGHWVHVDDPSGLLDSMESSWLR